MAVKYQQRIHEAFVNDVLLAEPRKKLEEALADDPELFATMKDHPVKSEEADAILGGNVAICEYFATKCEEGSALVFSTEHTKSVKQTVRVNLNYYKNITRFVDEETEEPYTKIYAVIQKKLDEYFENAAEDILADIYGNRYTEFFDAKTADFAEKAKRHRPKKNAGEEE